MAHVGYLVACFAACVLMLFAVRPAHDHNVQLMLDLDTPTAAAADTADSVRTPAAVNRMVREANAVGEWYYNPALYRHTDVLVVMGGQVNYTNRNGVGNDVSYYANLGYKVWAARNWCKGVPHDDLWYCGESFGYFSYLADADPAKPTADVVVFVHGHPQGAHQFGVSLGELIPGSVMCAKKTQRFTPLTATVRQRWQYLHTWQRMSAKFNTVFAEWRRVKEDSTPWSAWCCAQFAVPMARIKEQPHAYYRRALKMLTTDTEYNGFFWEYVWHVVFGEDRRIDVSSNHPKGCPWIPSVRQCFKGEDLINGRCVGPPDASPTSTKQVSTADQRASEKRTRKASSRDAKPLSGTQQASGKKTAPSGSSASSRTK